MSMVVVSLTECPAKLRGDLSKWLFELNTGVYVGKLSARVRDELWGRICENIAQGKATMVYSANNEQGMEFRVHHTTWEPVGFDGVKLMRRPAFGKSELPSVGKPGSSKAAQYLKARNMQATKRKKVEEEGYIVADIETTGLSPIKDEIIEIGALHIVQGKLIEKFSVLLRSQKTISEEVQKLSGISMEMLEKEGIEGIEGLSRFLGFIKSRQIVFHNAGFDRAFLQRALDQYGLPSLNNPFTDTMSMAKRYLDDVSDFKLETIAHYLGMEGQQVHRAADDCMLTWFVYEKLNEIAEFLI